MLKELLREIAKDRPNKEEREYLIDSLAEVLAKFKHITSMLKVATEEEDVFFTLEKDGKTEVFDLPYPIPIAREDFAEWLLGLTSVLRDDFSINLKNFGWNEDYE